MGKLSVEEASQTGITHAVVFDYNDLQQAGTTGAKFDSSNQVEVATLESGALLQAVGITCLEAEAGATDITVDIGTTGADPDEYIDGVDLDALGAGDSIVPGVTASGFGDGTTANVVNFLTISSDTPLLCEISGTVANLTAGKWVVWANILHPGALS